MPYARRMSSTRSASAWVARLSAAAPKSVTVLMCPVRPNGRFSIIDAPFLSALVPGVLLVTVFLPHPAETGYHRLWEQDTDSPRVIGVVHERWDVYHGSQYRPLSPREQVPEGRRSTVCPPGCRVRH